MEIIYTGRQLGQDLNAIGRSSIMGSHETPISAASLYLINIMTLRNWFFGGGIIPGEETEDLRPQSSVEIFGPGSPTKEIVSIVEQAINQGAL